MANKQNTLGVKVLSLAALIAAVGAATFYWGGGYDARSAALQVEADIELSQPLYYEMDALVVNVAAGNSKTRYLKIRPTLVTRHQSFFDQLSTYEPVVQNHLLSLYTQKTAEELLEPSGFEALREESLNSLQEALKDKNRHADVVRCVVYRVCDSVKGCFCVCCSSHLFCQRAVKFSA